MRTIRLHSDNLNTFAVYIAADETKPSNEQPRRPKQKTKKTTKTEQTQSFNFQFFYIVDRSPFLIHAHSLRTNADRMVNAQLLTAQMRILLL